MELKNLVGKWAENYEALEAAKDKEIADLKAEVKSNDKGLAMLNKFWEYEIVKRAEAEEQVKELAGMVLNPQTLEYWIRLIEAMALWLNSPKDTMLYASVLADLKSKLKLQSEYTQREEACRKE